MSSQADAVLLSQTRVCFAWIILATFLAATSAKTFIVKPRELLFYAALGVLGVAGANYFLYHAIGEMNAALADLIQFTAPILVVVWMAVTREERLDRAKLIGLVLSVVGCALALGITDIKVLPPRSGVVSAALSAICFSITIILGKRASGRLPVLANLHYSLMFATIFWLFITPPWILVSKIESGKRLGILVVFSVTSILLPYLFFFSGLRRVPASRAGIVSTFEPVVVALGSWILLSEKLAPVQVVGVALVCTAIVLVEVTGTKTRDHAAIPLARGND